MALRRLKMSEEQVKAHKAKINKAAKEAYAANPEKFRETQKRCRMRERLAVSGACTTDRSTQTSTLDLNALGAKLGQEWPTSLDFQRVIDRCNKIRAGKEDESSLLVLDIEVFLQARNVFEVGLMQFNSGKTLIDERVDHRCTLEELLVPSDGKLLKRGSRCFGMGSIQRVYGGDPNNCPGTKTAEEIAEMLIKAKITPHSIILVWHNSAMDLELLRELLDTAGYPNILPGKKNCITFIQQFRLGLPLNFSAALDVIFPVPFAGDALVGTNHRAMPDVKMTRKMVQLLFELQKPLSARILSDFSTATQNFV